MPTGQDVLQLAIVTAKWSHGMNLLTTIRQQWLFWLSAGKGGCDNTEIGRCSPMLVTLGQWAALCLLSAVQIHVEWEKKAEHGCIRSWNQ